MLASGFLVIGYRYVSASQYLGSGSTSFYYCTLFCGPGSLVHTHLPGIPSLPHTCPSRWTSPSLEKQSSQTRLWVLTQTRYLRRDIWILESWMTLRCLLKLQRPFLHGSPLCFYQYQCLCFLVMVFFGPSISYLALAPPLHLKAQVSTIQ